MSVADDIKLLKELLDLGAITQDEFDFKKVQLLDSLAPARMQPQKAVLETCSSGEGQSGDVAAVSTPTAESDGRNGWVAMLVAVVSVVAVVCIFCFAVLLFGVQKDTIAGTWYDNYNKTITFKSDGTFDYFLGDGTWTLSNKTVTLVMDGSTAKSYCTLSDDGKTITGSNYKFTRNSRK